MRPITFLNTLYKLLSSVLADRLKPIQESIIGAISKAYIPGRFSGEVTRTIYDIFQYAKQNNLPGMLLLIDFQKAFDSVFFKLSDLTLKFFGFCPNYRKWISITLKGFLTCTVVNGKISQKFTITKDAGKGTQYYGIYLFCALKY